MKTGSDNDIQKNIITNLLIAFFQFALANKMTLWHLIIRFIEYSIDRFNFYTSLNQIFQRQIGF